MSANELDSGMATNIVQHWRSIAINKTSSKNRLCLESVQAAQLDVSEGHPAPTLDRKRHRSLARRERTFLSRYILNTIYCARSVALSARSVVQPFT